MAAQYLLPCECGNTTPIDTSQAGDTVVCQCGQRLEVPSLRAIRELTPHADQADQRKYEWSPAAGMIFVGGMLLALVGGGAAAYTHTTSVQMVNFNLPPEADVAAWVEQVDEAPPQELFDIWNAARDLGLGDHRASPFVQYRLVSERYVMYRNMSLIVMASGLVFAGTSIFVRRKPIG